jgi:uroporphyrinogen decarboxylase
MIEGSGSKTFSKAKRMLYVDPALSHALLQKITDSTIGYLKGQIAAGADVVQLFDSWAGILRPSSTARLPCRTSPKSATPLRRRPKRCLPKTPGLPAPTWPPSAATPSASTGRWTPWNRGGWWARQNLAGQPRPCVLYADYDTIRRETRKMLKGVRAAAARSQPGARACTPTLRLTKSSASLRP